MKGRAIFLILCSLALGSCSSSYEIRAFILDGKLAFEPVGIDFWGNPDPDSFYSISVEAVDGPAATPAEGESVGLAKNGTYWNRAFAVTSCENKFPVVYGTPLHGPPFREHYQYEVAAKPLVRGVTYSVSASSNGSEYGGGRFMFTADSRVKNLPQ